MYVYTREGQERERGREGGREGVSGAQMKATLQFQDGIRLLAFWSVLDDHENLDSRFITPC
jgi:hypothetical protein